MGDTSWDTLKLGMSTCDLLLRVCGLRKSIKEKGHRKVLSSLQATVCIGREKMGVVPVAPICRDREQERTYSIPKVHILKRWRWKGHCLRDLGRRVIWIGIYWSQRAVVGEEVGRLAGGKDGHSRWSHLESLMSPMSW